MGSESETGTPPGNPPESGQPELGGLAAGLAHAHGAGVPGASGGEPSLPPKRKAGRPPIHGRYSQAAGSDGKRPVAAAGEGPLAPPQVDGLGAEPERPRVVLPPHLAAKLARIPWAKINEAMKGSLADAGATLPDAVKEEVAELIRTAGFSEEEVEFLAEITPLVAEEWSLDFATSPTVALLVTVTLGGANYFRAANTLKKLAKKQAPVAGTPATVAPR